MYRLCDWSWFFRNLQSSVRKKRDARLVTVSEMFSRTVTRRLECLLNLWTYELRRILIHSKHLRFCDFSVLPLAAFNFLICCMFPLSSDNPRHIGLKRCRDLAQVHVEKAIEAILALDQSLARDALVALACKVVARWFCSRPRTRVMHAWPSISSPLS